MPIHTTNEQFVAELDRMLTGVPGVEGRYKITFLFPGESHIPHPASSNLTELSPWWTQISEVVSGLGATLVPEVFPAATDSRYYRRQGFNAYGVSPLSNTPRLLHMDNERVSRSTFLAAISFYEDLVAQLANVADFDAKVAEPIHCDERVQCMPCS